MANWHGITGLNRAYLLELYDRYLADPSSVDAEARTLFATWAPPAGEDGGPVMASAAGQVPASLLQKAVGAVNLAQSIRQIGRAHV